MALTEEDAIKRKEMAKGLREFADCIETYGGEFFPLPSHIIETVGVTVSEYTTEKDEEGNAIRDDDGNAKWVTIYDHDATLARLRKAIRGLRGRKEKVMNDFAYSITKNFGEYVTFKVEAQRAAICKKVPTGNKVIHEAYTHHTPRRVEEEYEWVCEDNSLLASTKVV